MDVDEVGDGLRHVDAHGEEEGNDGDGDALELVLLQDAELLQMEVLERAVDDDGEDELVIHHVGLRRVADAELRALRERARRKPTRRRWMRNFTERRLSIATRESRIIAFSLEYIDRRLENMICT